MTTAERPSSEVFKGARVAYERARDTYLAEHPEPKPDDFRCRRCRADPGTPCTVLSPGSTATAHAPRIDRAIRAFQRHQLESVLAAEAAHDRYLQERKGDAP